MDLIERETQMAALAAALNIASAGRGSVVVVTGEAGVGKTALVRRFVADAGARGKTLWGVCDGLVAPRPLGPFRDIAGQIGLSAKLSVELPEAVVAALGGSAYPTVVVVEDAHWADDATIEAIRFVGRRVVQTNALLVVTFRDDEVPGDHPLRRAIGAIPSDDIHRLMLPRLSRHGVAGLAGHENVEELYRITRGNPFYVNEVLAAQHTALPQTVQDAVLARVSNLTVAARETVEAVSVVPGRAERWLLDSCETADGVDEASQRGVLITDDYAVSFPHEIARRAVEHNLSAARREELNHKILTSLAEHNAEPARLAHHAVQADDAVAVARHGPSAARVAASLDSHQEAADHFEQALMYADRFDDDELAAMLYEYAYELYVTDRHAGAAQALEQAVDLLRPASDHERLGRCLCILADVRWFLGQPDAGREAVAQAMSVLEQDPPGKALAWAYSQSARFALSEHHHDQAIDLGGKAIAVARSQDDTKALVHAQRVIGLAQWMIPPFDNHLVLDSLELARSAGLPSLAGWAYVGLAAGHLHHMEYAKAGPYFDEGLTFCEVHDLLGAYDSLLLYRAEWNLEQGRWADAERDANGLLSGRYRNLVHARYVLGRLQARRGEPAAETTLADDELPAEHQGEKYLVIYPSVAHVELAWLRGDREGAAAIAGQMVDTVITSGDRRWRSAAVLWLHRVGVLPEPPDDVMEPYALQIAGQWRQAASAWAELGRPYEQADALGEASEPAPLLEALKILDALGARPRAAMIRRRLTEMGVTSIPRGPRASTLANPAGLTERQAEVLRLLAGDLTYQEIAQRLHLSVKTVDHHVAAVRTKLGVTTRAEAVSIGRSLGILDEG